MHHGISNTDRSTNPSTFMQKVFRPLKIVTLVLIGVIFALILLLYRNDIPVEKLRTRYAADTASRFMDLMGMQVHYRDEGLRDDSIPLVFVHGLSSSLHTWDSLTIKMIGKERIIRMDLPAFGLTGPNPEQKYDLAFYNIFLDSFLSRLGVHRYIMAGNSLGGAIAWNQALAYPQKVSGLILVNAAGYPRKDEKGSIGFKLAATPLIGDLLTGLTPRILIQKSLENTYFDRSRITPEIIDRYHNLLLREGNRKAMLQFFKTRRIPDHQRIKMIDIPTLIIWGRHDQLISVENAYAFQRDIPGSRLVIFDDAGHIPMEENPTETFNAMMPFLQSF